MADFVATSAIEVEVRAIQADSAHADGVRVRLLPGATYANLVAVLDIMNFTNQKKYWLDIRHQPATWYAITEVEASRHLDAAVLTRGCCSDIFLPPSPGIWQQQLAATRQLAWQLPLLLLAALSGLTIYRLVGLAQSRPG